MPDPIPPPQPAPNITLTSSEPVAVSIRSGLQLLSGAFIVEGIELFIYDFGEDQAKWATGLFTLLLVFVQNFFEKRRGQKFLGAAPQPATRDDGAIDTVTAIVFVVGLILGFLLCKVGVG